MKLLLISENATIQKLFSLSAQRRGDEVFTGGVENIPDNKYDVIFIDKESLNNGLLDNLKQSFEKAKFVLILNKKDEKIPGFDKYIHKPFLPTDLIDLLENINENEKNEESESNNKDEFDLESFDKKTSSPEEEEAENKDDFVINDEELEKEVEEDDEDEDFIVDESELEEENTDSEFLDEDVIEEKGLEEEMKDKGDIDAEIEINDEQPAEKEEETKSGEVLEEVPKSEEKDLSSNENFDLSELEDIKEKELAEAVGEDIGKEPKNEENKHTVTVQNNENNSGKNTTLQEKTLGNILNINWEELKKAKAKVSITIDFGD